MYRTALNVHHRHQNLPNHSNSGQVCIGNTDDIELLEPEPETTPEPLSCAELTASGEQDLLVNDWMATVVGQYVYKLLHRQPIHTFLSFINLDALTVQSRFHALDYFL